MKKDLGFVFVLVLVLLFSQFQVVEADDGWDKSSLSFVAGCGVSCDQIEVTVCNTGDGDMTTEVPWELWYAVSGNPKNGEIIATGMLSPLEAEACAVLSYDSPVNGNYMFHVYQVQGHPGQGDLWSDECSVNCTEPTMTPPPTEIPTATQVLPTPTYTATLPLPTTTVIVTETVTEEPTEEEEVDPTATPAPQITGAGRGFPWEIVALFCFVSLAVLVGWVFAKLSLNKEGDNKKQ